MTLKGPTNTILVAAPHSAMLFPNVAKVQQSPMATNAMAGPILYTVICDVTLKKAATKIKRWYKTVDTKTGNETLCIPHDIIYTL